jgi:opacity protein-like surface antigen
MKRFATAAFAAATLLASQSVFAQTSAPATSAGSESWFNGLTAEIAGGVTITKKTGGFVGVEVITKEYWPKIAFSVEGGWMSSVVSGHQVDSASAIANYLAQTQGQPASATVKSPAGYGAVNVRYSFHTEPRYHPYALVGVGFGVTNPKTTFTLGGADVTGSIPQYGVALGKDLAGSAAGALLNLGVGATHQYGKWVGDVSYRFTPIFAAGHATLVNRFSFGIGRKF